MNIPNTDLLPPLFDKIRSFYAESTGGAYIRADIIRAFENGLVNAAVDYQREREKLPGHKERPEQVELHTSDRLSGEHLSRAALTEQIQTISLLDAPLVEIALLMIEAQIDLRLDASGKFQLSDIEFDAGNSDLRNGAAWCHDLLQPTISGSLADLPSFWRRFGQKVPESIRIFTEALPLSATLRKAIPYTIRVPRRLVDPKLDTPRADSRVRILHISDLHLVEDLQHPQRAGSPTLGQKKHNEKVAEMLGRVTSLLEPRFDLLVATGDLTTDGHSGSFETLLQFIQAGPMAGENKLRIANYGLNASRDNRILIPGNHDRFEGERVPSQRLNNRFEQMLGTPTTEQYPYLRAFRPPNAVEETPTLLLFVFDSTLPEGADATSVEGIRDAPAAGRIGGAEIDRMKELAREAAKNQIAVAVGGSDNSDSGKIKFDRHNTVRIALLHHHPVISFEESEWERKRPRGFKKLFHPIEAVKSLYAKIEHEGMALDGADEFLTGCFEAGIQLVLFGHKHKSYRRAVTVQRNTPSEQSPMVNPASATALLGADERALPLAIEPPLPESPFGSVISLRTFCCPTTLERTEKGNGFYVFDFADKDTFAVHYFLSRLGKNGEILPFTRISDQSGQLTLGELTDEEQRTSYVLRKLPTTGST